MAENERLKVYIWPSFGGEDTKGDGGVRRVVEAQRRYLPHFGIDVVETMAEADVLAAHIAAPPEFFRAEHADKALVAHNHGFYWSEYEWGGDWAERDNVEVMRQIKAADIVTGPSDWVSNIIRRHTARDVRTVYHGVDPIAANEQSGGYVLWNKTRVDPVCDPTPVRELAALLPRVFFRSTFYWSFGQDGAVPANVALLGRQGYVEALAEVAHAGVYLATARETFGIGTLEALAMGVPVVGFRWAGQEEIIDHLKDGYLAKVGDYDDLALGVQWALTHREAISPWCKAKAKLFTWARAIARYAEIYQEAAALRTVYRRQPKVSVVVTAYGLEKYLPDTLRSVQMQSLADWECIVVDDASPDGCGRIAEEWAAADPRFRVIHNAANQYLPESRNIAIREAKGRYIMPLDADDMLEPRSLEILAGHLDADRSLHVAYGGVRFVLEDGETPVIYQRHEDNPGHSGWPVAFDLANFMARPGQPLPYASMFRIEAWAQTGGYRRRVRSSEDCDLFMRMASYGFTPRMVTQADTLIYRSRADSMSAAGWADDENKDWFPWRFDPSTLPAGGNARPGLAVAALDPPVVSVIIACGPDHAHLVKDAVDSVDAQLYRQWECIVVNDTGLDLPDLPAWVRQVDARAGEWYATLMHKGEIVVGRAAGVVEARNKGIAAARGRFVLFLDADDFLMPNALDVLLQAERWAGGEAVIYSDFWENPKEVNTFTAWQLPDYECDLVLQKALHAVTALYPREAIEKVGGFSPGVPWEDWDLQLKLAEAGVCSRRVALPLWTYRKETGSRREDRYTRREDGKSDMLALWGDYIEGRKTLAGCASCGGGRATTYYPQPARGTAGFYAKPAGMPQDAVMLEFSRAGGGKQTLRGRATNVLYNFQAGRPRWVDARDVAYFLELTGMRRIDPPAPAPEFASATASAQAFAPSEMPIRAPGPPAPRPVAVTERPPPPYAAPRPEPPTTPPAETPALPDLPRDPFAAPPPPQAIPTDPEGGAADPANAPVSGQAALDAAVAAEGRRQWGLDNPAPATGGIVSGLDNPASGGVMPPQTGPILVGENQVATDLPPPPPPMDDEVTRTPIDDAGNEVETPPVSATPPARRAPAPTKPKAPAPRGRRPAPRR